MSPTIAFLDYNVIDDLYRLSVGNYRGAHAAALRLLEVGAATGRFGLWMAEITKVEMIIGRENPKIGPDKVAEINGWDKQKIAIAVKLGVRWLGYPCSKTDDQYSRLDVSFRPDRSNAAALLEARLEKIAGITPGDAQQVVSLVHGFDDTDLSFHPPIQWFVTEDSRLRTALQSEVDAGRLPEMAHLHIGSVAEFVAA